MAGLDLKFDTNDDVSAIFKKFYDDGNITDAMNQYILQLSDHISRLTSPELGGYMIEHRCMELHTLLEFYLPYLEDKTFLLLFAVGPLVRLASFVKTVSRDFEALKQLNEKLNYLRRKFAANSLLKEMTYGIFSHDQKHPKKNGSEDRFPLPDWPEVRASDVLDFLFLGVARMIPESCDDKYYVSRLLYNNPQLIKDDYIMELMKEKNFKDCEQFEQSTKKKVGTLVNFLQQIDSSILEKDSQRSKLDEKLERLFAAISTLDGASDDSTNAFKDEGDDGSSSHLYGLSLR